MLMTIEFGWVVTYHGGLSRIKSYNSWSRGLLKSLDKLKPLYLYYQSAYGHQFM